VGVRINGIPAVSFRGDDAPSLIFSDFKAEIRKARLGARGVCPNSSH